MTNIINLPDPANIPTVIAWIKQNSRQIALRARLGNKGALIVFVLNGIYLQNPGCPVAFHNYLRAADELRHAWLN